MTEIKWEAPPPSNRGRTSDAYSTLAEQLRQKPGQWAVFAEVTSPSASTNIQRGVLKAFRPQGAFEATTRAVPDTRNKVKIWVRYVGGTDE